MTEPDAEKLEILMLDALERQGPLNLKELELAVTVALEPKARRQAAAALIVGLRRFLRIGYTRDLSTLVNRLLSTSAVGSQAEFRHAVMRLIDRGQVHINEQCRFEYVPGRPTKRL